MIEVTANIAGRQLPIRFPETVDDTEEFLTWASTRKALACDTETTTYARFTAPDYQIRLVQFADAEMAWCLDPEQFQVSISKVLYGSEILLFANAPFDIGVLNEAGLASCAELWPKAHDIFLLAHLYDSRGRRLKGCPIDLKSLAYRYIENWPLVRVLYAKGGPSSEKKEMRAEAKKYGYDRAGDEFTRIPITNELYLRYAGADALYTYLLGLKLRQILQDPAMDTLYERERRFQALVHDMEQRGFLLDDEHATGLEIIMAADLDRMRQELAGEWGLDKPNSPVEVAAAMEAAGLEWDETTREGAKSTARSVLESIEHPLTAAMLDYRAEMKALTACVRPLRSHVGWDGRIHASYKTLGCVTGRMSCKNPNVQQLPKRRNTAQKLRSCVIADEGKVIVAADLSQIEYRVAASLSKDPRMLEAFANGEDLHVMAAKLVFGTDNPTDTQRSLAKSAGFGKIYGAGAQTIARQTRTTIDAARRVVDTYSDVFSGLDNWSKELVELVKFQLEAGTKAKVTTPYGRKIPIDPERPYVAVNYMCQSTARDVLVDWIFEFGSTEGLLAIIHDELVFEVDPADAEDLARTLEKAATKVELPDVPVLAEAKVGERSWGSLYRKDQPPVDTDRNDDLNPDYRDEYVVSSES